MSKYPGKVPSEQSNAQVIKLVEDMRGFSGARIGASAGPIVSKIRNLWEKEYKEKLDQVMFDNLASYEP
jgi:hypothetical protein